MTISKIIPDERSNQLIVIASERAYAAASSAWSTSWTCRSTDGDGRIHVYYCENANCDELAQTLGAVTGVSVRRLRAAPAGGTRRQGGGARAGARAPAGQGQAQGIQNLLFEGDVRITFDARPTR